jgi:hypothetical protein
MPRYSGGDMISNNLNLSHNVQWDFSLYYVHLFPDTSHETQVSSKHIHH